MKTKGDTEHYKPNHCFYVQSEMTIANRNQFSESVIGLGSTLNITDSHTGLFKEIKKIWYEEFRKLTIIKGNREPL